jgi:hypothetical protein
MGPRALADKIWAWEQEAFAVKAPRTKRRDRGPAAPRLTIDEVLAWADAYHEATGAWPTRVSGKVTAGSDDTWQRIDWALRRGHRGLGVKTSLPRLLNERRGVPNPRYKSALTVEQILAWADAFHEAHGRWPSKWDEPGAPGPDERWERIDHALREGLRGLLGGTTLAWLLLEHRKARAPHRPAELSIDRILEWADAHRAATGCWPTVDSGPVTGAPGETWAKVQGALFKGGRGLPEKTSLAGLLIEHRGARKKRHLSLFTQEQILEWADHHHRLTGRWPQKRSGSVLAAPGETWRGIDHAFRHGYRGLPGGSSLAQALAESRQVQSPPLSLEQIFAWAVHHLTTTGRRPARNSGPVAAAPGQRWVLIDNALRHGRRGLPGGSSLAQFLDAHIASTRKRARPTVE